MEAEIIAVGTELLLGQVVNTNATFLSEELAGLGVEVYYHTVVGDNADRLTESLDLASKRSDFVVLCGGLGPTDDDLTKEVVAKFLDCSLKQDEQGLNQLNQFFAFSKKEMSKNNLRQILTINGGLPIQNPTGLAVGTIITKEGVTYLLLPGPPNELKPMFKQAVVPILKTKFKQNDKLMSRVLRFYGIGESQLVTDIKELIDSQSNPTIAPYAKTNEVTLRITAKVGDEQTGTDLLNETENRIMEKVGEFFYGYGEDTSLAEIIVNLLKANGKTISAAESLTAGLFQSTLGSISGVSEVLKGGFVTYSQETKEKLLGIPKKMIEEHGMVSSECARAMAEQARVLADSDLAISFTGVAGPKELEDQPAGTVWIALAERNHLTQTILCHFNRDRNYVRQSAVMKGLDMIRLLMLSKNK